jgi:hypothetical protein
MLIKEKRNMGDETKNYLYTAVKVDEIRGGLGW